MNYRVNIESFSQLICEGIKTKNLSPDICDKVLDKSAMVSSLYRDMDESTGYRLFINATNNIWQMFLLDVTFDKIPEDSIMSFLKSSFDDAQTHTMHHCIKVFNEKALGESSPFVKILKNREK